MLRLIAGLTRSLPLLIALIVLAIVIPVDVTDRDGGSDKEVVLEMVFDRSLLFFLSGRTGGSEKGGCKIAE